MADQISGTTEIQGNQVESDPWAAAFAALEQKGEEAPAAVADGGSAGNAGDGTESGADADGADGQDLAQVEGVDGGADEAALGGLDTPAGTGVEEGGSDSGSAFAGAIGVTEESIRQFEETLDNDIRTQAINEVAGEFVKRGIRNRNGVLGATLDDPDICKRDSDGVPRFYNPETGREFTGDNPRRQAQEWVDDYNKELARVFNNTCEQYEQHLKEESAPRLAVMKFAPKYEKLDDIRRGMFDNVIQDYEIKDDDGDVIGYNCDLDKALALVDRQIEMIQSYAKRYQAQQKPQPTGPVLDMKTSSGAVQGGDDAPPTSLAEAMERKQNELLEKLKKN